MMDRHERRHLNTLKRRIKELEEENEALIDALNHCGYDPDDCIDCGGPPHNEHCRFWKLRHLLSYWDSADTKES